MALSTTPIYLSTFLLERNRWNGKGPSLLLSDWIEPAAEAGFRGLEIWAPHLFFSSRSEWEALRQQAGDADLSIPFLYAPLPTDPSDKSNRQRDSLLEAAAYFEPLGLKFAVPEDGKGLEEKSSFVADWARDLPRSVRMVCAFEQAPRRSEALALYRKKLGARFSCSLNPFQDTFEDLFREAGEEAVINLGVRVLSEGKGVALRDTEEACAKAVSLAQRLNFKGSWTLECTAGVGMPGEDIELLFDEAEEDLNYLTGLLSPK